MTTTVIAEQEDEAVIIVTEESFDTTPNYIIISFTRDLTAGAGTQTIVGVGFQPRRIALTAAVVGGGEMASITSVDALTAGGLIHQQAIHAITTRAASVGSAAAYQYADLTSLNNDGFVLTWGKVGSPTGTAQLIATCYR